MAEDSPGTYNWSDTDLTRAVAASRSWRGVMRELGLCVTSTGSIRVVKRRVALLKLDTSHFTGQRTWSDASLKRAVAHTYSWDELLAAIGVKGRSGDERIRVKAHALRLGLDLSHLTDQPHATSCQAGLQPVLRNLRQAATSLAALAAKNPLGLRVKPAYSTGMTGKSSGLQTWVWPKLCHTTMSVFSIDRFCAA